MRSKVALQPITLCSFKLSLGKHFTASSMVNKKTRVYCIIIQEDAANSKYYKLHFYFNSHIGDCCARLSTPVVAD